MNELIQVLENTQELIKNAFNKQVQNVFLRYPGLTSISFTCYTPHFSDGDPCSYGVYSDYPDFEWERTPGDKEEADVNKYLQETVFKDLPNSMFYYMFGDHVKVTLYRDKPLVTEEYEHD